MGKDKYDKDDLPKEPKNKVEPKEKDWGDDSADDAVPDDAGNVPGQDE